MYEKDVIYEILKLRYVDRKKNSEINSILGTNNTALSKYFKKITKEKFLLHIESGETQSEFIENHPEIFCQQRRNRKFTEEHRDLIQELCFKYLNFYKSKEDAQIIRSDKLDGIFYIKHGTEWMENKDVYNLEREKFLKRLKKELAKITSGKDLEKNYKAVFEIFCQESKDRNLEEISYSRFYNEARKYWIEEE